MVESTVKHCKTSYRKQIEKVDDQKTNKQKNRMDGQSDTQPSSIEIGSTTASNLPN